MSATLFFRGGGRGIAGRRPVRCDRCSLHCSRQPLAQFGRRRGSLITCRLYDVRRFYRKNVLHDAPVSPNKTDRRPSPPRYAARCDMALGRDALWDDDDVARWKTSCRPRPGGGGETICPRRDGSSTRGGSASVRGRVCSPRVSGCRRWLSCRQQACQ